MSQPPIQPNTNSNSQSVESVQQPFNESMLKSDKYGQEYTKKIILGWLTGKVVDHNESQQISTGVSLYDFQQNGYFYNRGEDKEHFAASVNKLPVSLLVLQDLRSGKTTLDQPLSWSESDRRDGAGAYDQTGSPTTATVREVLHDMLNRSGNTAVRILVNKTLSGGAAVNERLSQIPEIPHTRLIPLDADRFYLGNTTSKEAMIVLKKLVVDTPDQYSDFLKELLRTNIYTDIGVRSQLSNNDYIVLVNKIGQLNDPDGSNRHDVGIVYNQKTHKTYGFSYMTTSPYNDGATPVAAEDSLKAMGRMFLLFSGDYPKYGHGKDNKDKNTSQAPKLESTNEQLERGKVRY